MAVDAVVGCENSLQGSSERRAAGRCRQERLDGSNKVVVLVRLRVEGATAVDAYRVPPLQYPGEFELLGSEVGTVASLAVGDVQLDFRDPIGDVGRDEVDASARREGRRGFVDLSVTLRLS